ncbi:MAG TPA: hypothetical protein VM142_01625 [Acidimicrobiales bacterium]|nr:hypothetical protein [Acidimicrobiales bacterium]
MSPHGGRRRGKPGKAYGQRTDLNTNRSPLPVEVASGQPYGARKAQEDAQRAMPLSAPPAPPQATMGAVAPAPAPGSLGDPLRPTERPEEPISAGVDWGPGPGSEALAIGTDDPSADELRAIYARYPTEALREAIEALEG